MTNVRVQMLSRLRLCTLPFVLAVRNVQDGLNLLGLLPKIGFVEGELERTSGFLVSRSLAPGKGQTDMFLWKTS